MRRSPHGDGPPGAGRGRRVRFLTGAGRQGGGRPTRAVIRKDRGAGRRGVGVQLYTTTYEMISTKEPARASLRAGS